MQSGEPKIGSRYVKAVKIPEPKKGISHTHKIYFKNTNYSNVVWNQMLSNTLVHLSVIIIGFSLQPPTFSKTCMLPISESLTQIFFRNITVRIGKRIFYNYGFEHLYGMNHNWFILRNLSFFV